MWMGKRKITSLRKARGSFTVEAAVIVPVVLLCILWMAEAGITLYEETVELVQKQEMWQEFHPAAKFRKLELLEDMVGRLS